MHNILVCLRKICREPTSWPLKQLTRLTREIKGHIDFQSHEVGDRVLLKKKKKTENLMKSFSLCCSGKDVQSCLWGQTFRWQTIDRHYILPKGQPKNKAVTSKRCKQTPPEIQKLPQDPQKPATFNSVPTATALWHSELQNNSSKTCG